MQVEFRQQQPTKRTPTDRPVPPAIERARKWVDAHWNENPSLERVAAEVRISRFHFHRLFKRHTKTTLKKYVDNLRMAEARRLLRNGVPIRDIATALGFAHQSHFTSRFRQRVGVPPLRWLRTQATEAPEMKDAA